MTDVVRSTKSTLAQTHTRQFGIGEVYEYAKNFHKSLLWRIFNEKKSIDEKKSLDVSSL